MRLARPPVPPGTMNMADLPTDDAARAEPTARDAHQALRDDVRLLGEMLGDTLREHGGEALFALIERLRRLAVDARAGRVDAAVLPPAPGSGRRSRPGRR